MDASDSSTHRNEESIFAEKLANLDPMIAQTLLRNMQNHARVKQMHEILDLVACVQV